MVDEPRCSARGTGCTTLIGCRRAAGTDCPDTVNTGAGRRQTPCWHRRAPARDSCATWRTTTAHSRHRDDMELGHWVTGSMGHLGHLSRPGHRVIILTRYETRVFPVFEKAQNKDIKIYIFVKIRPTAIDILTFHK